MMKLLHSGKVRDLYEDGADLIMVASDRVSVFDVVLPTPIPDKGAILTQLSLWWFDRLADLVPNHVISATRVPDEWAGRAIRCQRLDMIGVEAIARGYLPPAGLALESYRATGTICDIALPGGLVEGSRLPEPVFTPTTKASLGEHDEFMSFTEVVAQVGAETAARLRELTLEVYRRGHGIALERGVIIADTKLEFGRSRDGAITLADEVLTPDSSRFWPAGLWQPGGAQPSMDKQYVRDWSLATGWDKRAPAPQIPPDVVAATRDRYVEAYELITGETWR
jgi:phosphoribosylaminoimidazole-succinocarboxamide synthase